MPDSRVEELLQGILEDGEYTGTPSSRIEAQLIDILGGDVDLSGVPSSRIEALIMQIKEKGSGGGEGGITPTGTLQITQNDTYDVTEYASAEVNVPAPALNLQEKTATPSGSSQDIEPDSQYEGLSKVVVEAIPDTYVVPTGTKDINQNGTHDVSGYASAFVSVPTGTARSSADLTANNLTVTAPAGLYAENASKTLSDSNLVAGNIKKDVTIFGTTGTYEGGGQSNWTLIDTKTFSLQEYTSTTAEGTDTGIDVTALDYAFMVAVITCDTAISSSTEWGMTVALLGRYINTGRVLSLGPAQQIGFATLSYAAMTSATSNANSYGVYISTNKPHLEMVRKCDSSHITKIRSGNYTVKLYGLASL